MHDQTVLDEAKELVYSLRQEEYGHPKANFEMVSKLWSIILGIEISSEQVLLCMTQYKIMRHILGKKKRDTLVDSIGYLALIERMDEEIEEKDGKENKPW